MKRAVYAGSFDPLTNGHVDIIQRGLSIADELVVVVAVNGAKGGGLFSADERVALIRQAVGDDQRIKVQKLEGLLTDFCLSEGISLMLRGLRAVADFEKELQMANMNRQLTAQVETVFLMTDAPHFYVSSSLVREIAQLGGPIERFVPPCVASALAERLS
jgi:pantetheine-phosphate adenylyltransferase